MKSIKPGRGPSMMGGVAACFAALFGVVWVFMASSIPGTFKIPFCLFGVIFVIACICIAIYNFKNATSKKRYSAFDITDGNEEPDPLNERFGIKNDTVENVKTDSESEFCPYCGAKTDKKFEFCNKCGKKLP